MNFLIDPQVKQNIPEISVVSVPVMNVHIVRNPLFEDSDLIDMLSELNNPDFYNKPMFKAYRDFYEKLGFDSNKNRPSVESMYRRYEKKKDFPNINNVVNGMNHAALKTLVPLGVFDMDNVVGDINLRYSTPGESLTLIGGDTKELPAGLIVMADQIKVLSQFFYRDSKEVMITEQTHNVLVLGCKVAGVDLTVVEDAVMLAAEQIMQKAGGAIGDKIIA